MSNTTEASLHAMVKTKGVRAALSHLESNPRDAYRLAKNAMACGRSEVVSGVTIGQRNLPNGGEVISLLASGCEPVVIECRPEQATKAQPNTNGRDFADLVSGRGEELADAIALRMAQDSGAAQRAAEFDAVAGGPGASLDLADAVWLRVARSNHVAGRS